MRRKVCERVSTHEACGRTDGIKRSRNKGLLAIALFKWFKSALLLLLSFGFLKLLHRDLGEVAEGVANNLRVDSDNRYLGALLAKLSLLDDKKLAALSALTFAYCALLSLKVRVCFSRNDGPSISRSLPRLRLFP